MSNKVSIYKVRDSNEKHITLKGDLFDLSFRLIITGKSFLSGKTNLLLNLLLQDDPKLYKKNFKGDNIYVFSSTANTDKKMMTLIEEKDIPDSNIFTEYDEEIVDTLYELRKEEYNEAIREKEKPENVLYIFDDMSFGNTLKSKSSGAIEKLFCAGRHSLQSIVILQQKYTQSLTCARENMTGGIFFKCSDKQLDLIAEEHNYLEGGKNQFKKMFRKSTNNPHSFLVINYSNPTEKMYLNKNFEVIGPCGEVKGKNCKCI